MAAQITPKHSLVGAYTDERDRANNTVAGRTSRVMDLRSLVPFDEPRSLLSLNYNGIVTQNLLLEGQFSRMRDRFTQGADQFQSGSDFRIHGFILCNKGGIAVRCSTISSSDLSSTDVYFGTDTSSGLIEYDPVPSFSHTSDFAVRSLFLNDKWDLNTHWGFNIGGRYDKAFGRDQAGHKTVDDSAMSPRLAANFDPKGNGHHRFSVSYGRYVSKVDQVAGDITATAGRYASYYWNYDGPVINAPGTPSVSWFRRNRSSSRFSTGSTPLAERRTSICSIAPSSPAQRNASIVL